MSTRLKPAGRPRCRARRCTCRSSRALISRWGSAATSSTVSRRTSSTSTSASSTSSERTGPPRRTTRASTGATCWSRGTRMRRRFLRSARARRGPSRRPTCFARLAFRTVRVVPTASRSPASETYICNTTAATRVQRRQLGVNKRLSKHYALQANYTLGRARGNVDNFRVDNSFVPGLTTIGGDRSYQWGPNDTDVRHVFVVNGTYEAPYGILARAHPVRAFELPLHRRGGTGCRRRRHDVDHELRRSPCVSRPECAGVVR